MSNKTDMDSGWFDRKLVQEALRRARTSEKIPGLTSGQLSESPDTIISTLIHDLFGAEILKTHKKKGWHFYNRINGDRIDLTDSETTSRDNYNAFEDISSSTVEVTAYFAGEDYSAFLMRFVRAFEEAVGLGNYQSA